MGQMTPYAPASRIFMRRAGSFHGTRASGTTPVVEIPCSMLTAVWSLTTPRAARPSVRSFAERVVTDHEKNNAELTTLARSKGIDVSSTLDTTHQAMRDRLSGLSGADFDRAYMSEMVRDHTEDVALFEREAQSASDADVKAYAARSLPTLREHLALARQVNSEVTLGPTVVPSAMAAAVVVPWCQGAYAPTAGTNFGNCAPAK